MPQQIYGNNRIFCNGRFISGPDARASMGTFLMILVPSIIWHLTAGKFLAEEYHPVLPAFAVIFQVAPLCFMLATTLSDPGIIPRQKDFSEYFDERSNTYRSKPPQRIYDMILGGHPFKLKYCITCNTYRPPRCTHCSVCENCVERFDHHCPWLGNCIGKRNYWLFYSFITTTAALTVLVLATCVLQLGVETSNFADNDASLSTGGALLKAMEQEWLSAAMVVYCVALVWFIVGLSLYHTYLIAVNQTTYENIKGIYSAGGNPFDRGLLGNFRGILCGKVRPRYFDPFTGRLNWPKQPQPLDVYSGESKQQASVAATDVVRPEAVGAPCNSDAPFIVKEHEEGGNSGGGGANHFVADEKDVNQENETYGPSVLGMQS